MDALLTTGTGTPVMVSLPLSDDSGVGTPKNLQGSGNSSAFEMISSASGCWWRMYPSFFPVGASEDECLVYAGPCIEVVAMVANVPVTAIAAEPVIEEAAVLLVEESAVVTATIEPTVDLAKPPNVFEEAAIVSPVATTPVAAKALIKKLSSPIVDTLVSPSTISNEETVDGIVTAITNATVAADTPVVTEVLAEPVVAAVKDPDVAAVGEPVFSAVEESVVESVAVDGTSSSVPLLDAIPAPATSSAKTKEVEKKTDAGKEPVAD